TSTATNFSGADNVASPNFWPNATLQALIGLSSVLDANYLNDSPQPFTLRSIPSGPRHAGALQAAR
uniref:hypothetical protein n=1 Tax=Variovorax sp. YR752 TaxID=1884383 RepID=UPI0031377131